MAKAAQAAPAAAAAPLSPEEENPAGDFTSEAPPGTGPELSAGAATSAVGGGPTLVKFVDEIDLKVVLTDIERLKAETSALKELKFSADSRIKELAEGIGEIRSMTLQREQTLRDAEARLVKTEEIVKNLQPHLILAELQKRDRDAEGTKAQLERTTMMLNETIVQTRDIQKNMERVRGVTNILDVDKDLNAKIAKIEEMVAASERFAAKAEKLYYEINKRMSDFLVLKEKTERVDALTRELLKEFDEKKIKLNAAASVDDLNIAKRDIEQKLAALREELGRKAAAMSERNAEKEVVFLDKPFSTEAEKTEGAPGRIGALLKQRDDIKSVLTLLEDEYRDGDISEKAFQEARKNNDDKLASLEAQIGNLATMPKQPLQVVSVEARAEEAASSAEDLRPSSASLQPPASQAMPMISPSQAPPVSPEYAPREPSSPDIRKREAPPVPAEGVRLEKGSDELEALLETINNLPSMHAQQRDLQRMLSILGRQYKNGVINEESYYDIKAKSEDKLAALNGKLAVMETLPAQLKLFREETKRLKKNKSELVVLLDLLDKQKTEGLMGEESYKAAKANASRKLGELDRRIEMLDKIVEKHVSPAPGRVGRPPGSVGKKKEKGAGEKK